MLLLSRDETFWSSFSSMSSAASEATRLFETMLREPARSEAIDAAIHSLRARAGAQAQDAKHKLSRSWITPLDRGEIHALVVRLDALADAVGEAAACASAYQPGVAPPAVVELAGSAQRVVREVERAVAALPSKGMPARVNEACRTIAHQHDVATTLASSASAEAFSRRERAMAAIRWHEIIRATLHIATRAEQTAFTLEGIALEHG